ncbi:MAG: hypothetical protein GYB65_08355, partial [Chloroflexi bacterium]|nr:hypothetical protein [Chloroflexota bacterium]
MTPLQRVWNEIRMAMIRRRLRHVIVLAAVDILVMWVAYTTAFSARTVTAGLLDFYRTRVAFMLFAGVLMCVIFYLSGIYHRIWSQTSANGITTIINATIVTTVLLVALNLIIEPRPLPTSVILVGNMLALNGFIIVRYRSRLIHGMAWRWRAIWKHEFPAPKNRVLIVG